jgi:molybdate transport system substrate-binding protein
MTIRMIGKNPAIGLAIVALLGYGIPAMGQGSQKASSAKPGDIRVIVTGAFQAPLEVVRAEAQKAVGKPLVIEYGSARGNLRDEILAGQAFEVSILLPDVNDSLIKGGKVMPETYEIASVPVAFGLRGDVPSVDVSSPEAVKKTLLAAKSVKYSPTGAALLTVKKVIGDLQLEGKIHDNSGVRGQADLGPGEYEINIYPLSEIIANKALKNLGPVTAKLQVPAVITAMIGKDSADVAASKALIKFLQSPQVNAALKASGMEKPKSLSATK